MPDNTTPCTIAFSRKSLTSAETMYSNIGREAFSILHNVEKFQHYCFACEVSMITDHKPSVAIFK